LAKFWSVQKKGKDWGGEGPPNFWVVTQKGAGLGKGKLRKKGGVRQRPKEISIPKSEHEVSSKSAEKLPRRKCRAEQEGRIEGKGWRPSQKGGGAKEHSKNGIRDYV